MRRPSVIHHHLSDETKTSFAGPTYRSVPATRQGIAWRARGKADADYLPPSYGCFNPRPASGAKASDGTRLKWDVQVSIRAPRAGRKPAIVRKKTPTSQRFNPRPASGAKVKSTDTDEQIARFQSAPRERGESKTVPRCHPNNGCFNPRPASGAKVMCGPTRTYSLQTFQSAPRERGESSARGNFTACPPTRFNPRPASGAKGITCSRASPAAGFNPRPASGAKGRSSSNR